MARVNPKTSASIPPSFEREGAPGRAAFELKSKLEKAGHGKLITYVDFINNRSDPIAIQFTSAPKQDKQLIAALKKAGVTQSESYIPSMPGRMYYALEGKRWEVSVRDSGDPMAVLASR